jgi:hypothetical protein
MTAFFVKYGASQETAGNIINQHPRRINRRSIELCGARTCKIGGHLVGDVCEI